MPTLDSFNHHQLKIDGRYPEWLRLFQSIPTVERGWKVEDDVVFAGHPETETSSAWRDALMQLLPWRKGPWCLAGVNIDSEWQGGHKWARLAPHLDLADKRCLDVGAGNGYFGWRMLAAGAHSVLACDPTALFVVQHSVVAELANEPRHRFLACRLENLPHTEEPFDVVFSMGVLSHRRYETGDHMAHLGYLTRRLTPDGELVLETLVVPDACCETTRQGDRVLLVQSRYARMKNVYALPSQDTLLGWLAQMGFRETQVLSVGDTTTAEQRATVWMPFQSLEDGLSQDHLGQTIEGYPRPKRAMVLARLH